MRNGTIPHRNANESRLFGNLQTLSLYLKYETFTVFTDHHALKHIINITEPSGLLTRYRLRLTEIDFKIKYKKGAENHHTDTLSSLLTGSTNRRTGLLLNPCISSR